MIEKLFLIENSDPVIFYGVNNTNIMTLKDLLPKLKIVARGDVVKCMGEDSEVEAFEKILHQLDAYCAKYNRLDEQTVVDFVKGNEVDVCTEKKDLIIYGVSGKPIVARTPNQREMVRLYDEQDLIFAVGPAGSGKTFVAISLAVRALKNREVKRIILSRPAVEAGEKLGFLPGDMKEKIDPYLQPLYDALQSMIPGAKLKDYMENGIIQIAPLAFMRGRTLNDAVIILDEAQNTTTQQIRMFLTRMGVNSKVIVTGDVTQIDLPGNQRSGLIDALRVLRSVKGVGKVEFKKEDIVRHPLVQRIVDAYEQSDEERKARREAEKALELPNQQTFDKMKILTDYQLSTQLENKG